MLVIRNTSKMNDQANFTKLQKFYSEPDYSSEYKLHIIVPGLVGFLIFAYYTKIFVEVFSVVIFAICTTNLIYILM